MKEQMIKTAVFLVLLSQIAAALEDTDCFKYYEFQKGLLFKDLMTMKSAYGPGEEVDVSYMLLSRMKAPITAGSVRAQMFYDDPVDGEQIIDEFYAAKDVSLLSGDILNQRFSWNLPKNAKEGTYTIKTYFIVGEYFNLAGISVLPYGPPGVPGELTTFTVKNQQTGSRIYFSKKDTTVNNQSYKFAAPAEIYENGELHVKTKLINVGPAKTAALKMDVYDWSDTAEKPMAEYSIEKTVNLAENGQTDVSYDISGLAPAAYEIRLDATSADERSLMKLRLPVSGVKGRFVYLGLDKFPLTKGEPTTIFACYSQSADYGTTFNGTITLVVLDEQGNQIYKEDSNTFEIKSTPPQGKTATFVPDKDTTNLVLKATMYDDKNNLQDTVMIPYDYSKFTGTKANLTIDTPKKTYMPGDTIAYSVSYADEKNRPLNGKILVYFSGPNGKLLETTPDIEIAGKYSGNYKIPDKEGIYSITARETAKDIKETIEINVTMQTLPTQTTEPATEETTTTEITQTQPQGPQQMNTIIWAAAGLILVILIALSIRRKKK